MNSGEDEALAALGSSEIAARLRCNRGGEIRVLEEEDQASNLTRRIRFKKHPDGEIGDRTCGGCVRFEGLGTG